MQFTPTSLRRTGRACLHASSSTGRHASDGESDPLAGTASSGLPGVPVCRDHVRQGPDWGRSMRPIVGQRLADLTRVTVRIAVTAATLSYLVRVGKRCRHKVASSVEVSVASHFHCGGRVGRDAFCAEHVSVASLFEMVSSHGERTEQGGMTVNQADRRSAPTLRQSTGTKICQEQRGPAYGRVRLESRSPIDSGGREGDWGVGLRRRGTGEVTG